MCEGSGFDVDPFGRVFLPNLGQFRIEVVDTNNNPITTFGKYGNEDSGGPGARVPKPAIPLAWPVYVAVSDRYAYVADTVNRRVVRVKLTCAVEAACGPTIFWTSSRRPRSRARYSPSVRPLRITVMRSETA